MEGLKLLLRPTVAADLDVLFRFQLDPEARYLAAFTSKESEDQRTYVKKTYSVSEQPNNQ